MTSEQFCDALILVHGLIFLLFWSALVFFGVRVFAVLERNGLFTIWGLANCETTELFVLFRLEVGESADAVETSSASPDSHLTFRRDFSASANEQELQFASNNDGTDTEFSQA